MSINPWLNDGIFERIRSINPTIDKNPLFFFGKTDEVPIISTIGTSHILGTPPTGLKDLQLEISQIVESVSSAFDDVYLVIERLARCISQPIFEVVRDPVEV